MSRLILVRHGETEGNVAKILDTRVPGLPLTERGVAQAKSFGANLAGPPRRLFCSPALRARQTAAHIEAVTGVRSEVVDGVHEVQVGELEGQNSEAAHKQFQRIYRAWHLGDLDERVPGGESGAEVLKRYLPVLERIRDDYLTSGEGGDILLVSHGAAMRLAARAISGVAPPFTTNNHLDNTETIELAPRADGGWDCLRWGRYTPPFGYEVEPTADDPMG
ncbi:histidine phosphatase family protein [Nocardia sp. CDC159]|uniref:Histidine phosphatase family protein n=1 Tax=Nocardia pulmonis TaxID=2951408 RepID=A0A9X2J0D0_9NOCA|nr:MULTISPECIES: histidine phosphatase family protein [Nocardia]MCM6776890.1 histidine phosphatase family protein [Nocardia pulmonis]MCM6789314.1 histidine phosphatase family protein [Nocardia sp. CDC159]